MDITRAAQAFSLNSYSLSSADFVRFCPVALKKRPTRIREGKLSGFQGIFGGISACAARVIWALF
ncbi:CLUMA_CG005944, isoform A [Clunio marinus]|uniref:CLUMA_CG005944, isoform A n=1 Tax=Clunio marinus TaxID=568069 RepID=A0A1J1HWE2_9DIPT|nr:CLUMA_CG005944, isoform A [Clunio marinus]